MFGFVFVVVTGVAVVWGRELVVGLKHFQAERLILNFSEAKPSASTSRLSSWHTHVPVITGSHSPGTSLGANSAARLNQLKQLQLWNWEVKSGLRSGNYSSNLPFLRWGNSRQELEWLSWGYVTNQWPSRAWAFCKVTNFFWHVSSQSPGTTTPLKRGFTLFSFLTAWGTGCGDCAAIGDAQFGVSSICLIIATYQ